MDLVKDDQVKKRRGKRLKANIQRLQGHGVEGDCSTSGKSGVK